MDFDYEDEVSEFSVSDEEFEFWEADFSDPDEMSVSWPVWFCPIEDIEARVGLNDHIVFSCELFAESHDLKEVPVNNWVPRTLTALFLTGNEIEKFPTR
jgi:hypothetical protein